MPVQLVDFAHRARRPHYDTVHALRSLHGNESRTETEVRASPLTRTCLHAAPATSRSQASTGTVPRTLTLIERRETLGAFSPAHKDHRAHEGYRYRSVRSVAKRAHSVIRPSRAVGSALLSSLNATRVAACLRRWTVILSQLPLPQGLIGRRALSSLSATPPVVDAIGRSRLSDRLFSPFTAAFTSAAPPARRARARGAPRTPHRT